VTPANSSILLCTPETRCSGRASGLWTARTQQPATHYRGEEPGRGSPIRAAGLPRRDIATEIVDGTEELVSLDAALVSMSDNRSRSDRGDAGIYLAGETGHIL
jgi:hypothetical protein